MLNWIKLTESVRSFPDVDRSVLVRLMLVGPVYDVAIFRGKRPDGSLHWILGDISLDHSLITHWSYIQDPELM